jgi:hypothetical protein
MRDITEQLRRYGEGVEAWLDDEAEAATVARGPDVGDRSGRRRRRRWHVDRRVLAGAVVAAAAAVTLAAVALWPAGPHGDDLRTQAPAETPDTRPAPTSEATAPITTSPETTAPTTTGTPGSPGDARPGPDSTGPTDSAALVPKTAAEIEAMMRPGAVIENVAITGGNIDVVADDVTIRNFRLDAGGASFGFRSCGPDTDCGTSDDQKVGFVAEDGEILNTAAAAFRGHHATLRRLEVHDSDAGAFTPLSDVTIEGSWWHHLGRGEGSANGVQLRGGTNIHVRGNFCDLPVTVPPPYNSSACVIAGTGSDPSLSALIERNWFNGGNHTVECNNVMGVAVHDNRFGRDFRTGPLSRCPSSSGNVWDDAGQPL